MGKISFRATRIRGSNSFSEYSLKIPFYHSGMGQ